MRPIRPLLAVVVVSVALAGCSRGGPAGDAASPATTKDTHATGTSVAGAAGPTAKPGPEAAVATARDFLQREVGMGELVAGRFEATGADSGEVSFRLRFGEGGSPMPATAPRTVVRLQRYRRAGPVQRPHRLPQADLGCRLAAVLHRERGRRGRHPGGDGGAHPPPGGVTLPPPERAPNPRAPRRRLLRPRASSAEPGAAHWRDRSTLGP